MPNRSASSLKVGDGDRDACTEVSRSASIESKSAIAEENIVLRKLLRKSRYFDSGDLEGHAVKSPPKNPRKRCYVCGDAQHTGNKCRKRRICYFCNERGHLAEDCSKSSQEYNICLRCGESGHDLFSCNNDYPPDDLKKIVCYICNKGGHICCHTCTNISPDTVSCYNCGESGHSGVVCGGFPFSKIISVNKFCMTKNSVLFFSFEIPPPAPPKKSNVRNHIWIRKARDRLHYATNVERKAMLHENVGFPCKISFSNLKDEQRFAMLHLGANPSIATHYGAREQLGKLKPHRLAKRKRGLP